LSLVVRVAAGIVGPYCGPVTVAASEAGVAEGSGAVAPGVMVWVMLAWTVSTTAVESASFLFSWANGWFPAQAVSIVNKSKLKTKRSLNILYTLQFLVDCTRCMFSK
jgi:hypothetical protein